MPALALVLSARFIVRAATWNNYRRFYLTRSPSVVSAAMDWCPADWKAEVDDVQDITRVAGHLLSD